MLEEAETGAAASIRSPVADGSVEGIGSRALSLSLIIFACVLSFTLWILLFLFPWSRDGIVWNCTYVMNCLLFSNSIKAAVSLSGALVSRDEELKREKLGATTVRVRYNFSFFGAAVVACRLRLNVI
jgi:hypothetical protein